MIEVNYVYAEAAGTYLDGEPGLIVVGSNAVAQDLSGKLQEWDVVSATTLTLKQKAKYTELFRMHEKIVFWLPEDSFKQWKSAKAKVVSAIVNTLPSETAIHLVIAAPCDVEVMVETAKCIFKPRLTNATLSALDTDTRVEYRYSRKLGRAVSTPVPFYTNTAENLTRLVEILNS